MTDGQGIFQQFTFLYKCRIKVMMDIFFISRRGRKTDRAVIGIKIKQQTAVAQYPVPIPIGRTGIGQIPGKITGKHDIKSVRWKRQYLGIPRAKIDGYLIFRCIPASFCYHACGRINRRDMMIQTRHENGQEPRASADIQYLQLAAMW